MHVEWPRSERKSSGKREPTSTAFPVIMKRAYESTRRRDVDRPRNRGCQRHSVVEISRMQRAFPMQSHCSAANLSNTCRGRTRGWTNLA